MVQMIKIIVAGTIHPTEKDQDSQTPCKNLYKLKKSNSKIKFNKSNHEQVAETMTPAKRATKPSA